MVVDRRDGRSACPSRHQLKRIMRIVIALKIVDFLYYSKHLLDRDAALVAFEFLAESAPCTHGDSWSAALTAAVHAYVCVCMRMCACACMNVCVRELL